MAKSHTSETQSDSSTIYEWKITLVGSRPPIWRRIQVADCTLDELHQGIQTAMGWTNSHLHQFEIGKTRYADPELIEDAFDEADCEDSCATMLSAVVGKRRKGFRFLYSYDFGDGWDHEIRLERIVEPEPGVTYPRCVAGARACPPEDVGGVSGYAHLLQVLANPRHEEYEDLREWAGDINPECFSPEEKTKDMRAGLPDWRSFS